MSHNKELEIKFLLYHFLEDGILETELGENLTFLLDGNYIKLIKSDHVVDCKKLSLMLVNDEYRQVLWFNCKSADSSYMFLAINIAFFLKNEPQFASQAILQKCIHLAEEIPSELKFKLCNEFRRLESLKLGLMSELYYISWASTTLFEVLTSLKSGDETLKNTDKQKISDLVNGLLSVESMRLSIPAVKNMAEQVNMSVTKFRDLFIEIYGESPYHYFLNRRFEYANNLIESGQFSLTQIAYKVGFNHPSGLTKLFVRKLGHAPLAIQKLMQ